MHHLCSTSRSQWGYESCRPTGSDARATTTLTINGATTPFSDEVSNCPTGVFFTGSGTGDSPSYSKHNTIYWKLGFRL